MMIEVYGVTKNKGNYSKGEILLIVLALAVVISLATGIFPSDEKISGHAARGGVQPFTSIYSSVPQERFNGKKYPDVNDPDLELLPAIRPKYNLNFVKNFAKQKIDGIERCSYLNKWLSPSIFKKSSSFCKFKKGSKYKKMGPYIIFKSNQGSWKAKAIEVDAYGNDPVNRKDPNIIGFHIFYNPSSWDTTKWKHAKYCKFETKKPFGYAGKSTCKVNLGRRGSKVHSVMIARAYFGNKYPNLYIQDVRLV